VYGLSVAVPVYRSELILQELVQRLEDVLRKASSRYELVLVNDCSTGFTTLPQQLASLIVFGLTLFGLGVLGWVLLSYFSYGGPVPGFLFLASIVAVFSGAQLFALGIVGEYAARIHCAFLSISTLYRPYGRGPGKCRSRGDWIPDATTESVTRTHEESSVPNFRSEP
jgi:hypothetical protein